MERTAVHYGRSPKGKKIHLGEDVNWTDRNGVSCVDAFCGVLMDTVEPGALPPRSRVREYCRRCFASMAWGVFEDSFLTEDTEPVARPRFALVS